MPRFFQSSSSLSRSVRLRCMMRWRRVRHEKSYMYWQQHTISLQQLCLSRTRTDNNKPSLCNTSVYSTLTELYSVSRKKETKMFLGISQTNLGRLSWNLIHGFLNKFAIKWCKSFPSHLNSVSTLPCKTWNAHCASATIEVIQKETPEFIPPQLWPPNSPDLNPVDYRVWEISQEKM